jgi:hypothetical protein
MRCEQAGCACRRGHRIRADSDFAATAHSRLWRHLASNPACPLQVRSSGVKRTRYAHSEFFGLVTQAVISRFEIPQRKSLLDYPGVLSFGRRTETLGRETARVHHASRRRAA